MDSSGAAVAALVIRVEPAGASFRPRRCRIAGRRKATQRAPQACGGPPVAGYKTGAPRKLNARRPGDEDADHAKAMRLVPTEQYHTRQSRARIPRLMASGLRLCATEA